MIKNIVRGYKLGMSDPGMVQWSGSDNMLLSRLELIIDYRLVNNSRDSAASFLLTPRVSRSAATRITTITMVIIVASLLPVNPMALFASLPVFIPKCTLSVGPKIVAV
jgi:hypothetical protein